MQLDYFKGKCGRLTVAGLSLLAFYPSAFANHGEEIPEDTVSVNKLTEIVVTGQSARQRLDNVQLGAENLELSRLALTPSFGGERDIIRAISLLPGVRSESDGGGGFEVRGGTASQNLITLDGINLYNPSHVMGIFSTFNDNALGRVTLYKGPFPASFGSATSAVLESSLASGDMEGYHYSGTIGMLAAKLHADGAIVKDRLSFAVDARRSYVDAFLQMVPKYRGTVMNFYDVSAKLRYNLSTRNMIDVSFFISHDNMAVKDVMGMHWGNLGASINWLWRGSSAFSLVTNLSFDHYSPIMEMSVMEMDERMRQYIHNYTLTEKLHIRLSDSSALDAGWRSALLGVKSGEWEMNGVYEKESRSVWENALWLNYDGNFAERWKLSAGGRLNLTSVITSPRFHDFVAVSQKSQPFHHKTYCDFEPRISVTFDIDENHNLKAGIGMTSQNLHSIRSSSTSMPFDRYALTSFEVRPERALQYGVGYMGMTSDGGFEWSAEAYYKSIRNVYDYLDGKNSFSDINLQSIIAGGKGRSYGFELMMRKNLGAFSGWLAYTLTHTQTKIAEVNDGRWFNATNDRRHDLSATLLYRINDKWNVSGAWIYYSGQPLTAPDVKYTISGMTCYYYSQRNSYKTPPTHRLDLAANYTHVGKRFTYEWSFGIYNAYCRYNPYIVYFEDDPSKPSGTRAVLQAMYGLIPSVSYTLKFN